MTIKHYHHGEFGKLLEVTFPRKRLCNCGDAFQSDEEIGGCGYALEEAKEKLAKKLIKEVSTNKNSALHS